VPCGRVGWSRLEPAVFGMGQPRPLLTEATLQPLTVSAWAPAYSAHVHYSCRISLLYRHSNPTYLWSFTFVVCTDHLCNDHVWSKTELYTCDSWHCWTLKILRCFMGQNLEWERETKLWNNQSSCSKIWTAEFLFLYE